MLFQVVGPDKKVRFATEDAACIYPAEVLKDMQQADYTFLLDGKKASVPQVLAACGAAPSSQGAAQVSQEKPVVTGAKTITVVRCVDTGKIYKNQAEAARDLRIDSAQVSDSIKTGRKRSGYLFEKVAIEQ